MANYCYRDCSCHSDGKCLSLHYDPLRVTLSLFRLRFFQICKIDIYRDISAKEVVYLTFFTFVCLLIYISGIQLQSLINFAGAVVGYFYIIAIPIAVHFKCVWFNKSSGFIENDEERNSEVKLNQCECDNSYKSKWSLYIETGFLIFVLIGGFALMILTLTGTA